MLGLVLTGAACTSNPVTTPSLSPSPTLSPTSVSTSTPSPTTITLWHTWPGSQEDVYTEVIEAFNGSHEDIQVDLLKVENLSEALNVAIPAGEGPDIIHGRAQQIGTWARSDLIAPLEGYLAPSFLRERFEPAAVQATVWQGQHWGLPDTQEGIALIYNRDIITGSMLPAPLDFTDLLEKAQLFRRENPDKYYLCNPGLGQADAYHVAPIYLGHDMQTYGGFIDAEGQAYLNSEAAYDAAAWIAEFSKIAPAETNAGICQAMFIEGQVPIWWMGNRALLAIEDTDLEYSIAPMGSPLVDVSAFMLTQNASPRGHAMAAIDVMQYLSGVEAQVRLALETQTVPANSYALEDPLIQADPILSGFGAALRLGTALPNHRYGDCAWGPVGDATLAIWRGELTPTEALNQAQTLVEACIAEIE